MKKVLKIRDIVLGAGRPEICLVLASVAGEILEKEINRAIDLDVKVFEYRMDLAEAGPGLTEDKYGPGNVEAVLKTLYLVRKLIGDRLLIFTCRSWEEGGAFKLSREEYKKINLSVGKSQLADIIDIELDREDGLTDLLILPVQVSHHSYEGGWEKDRSVAKFLQMQKYPAALTKLAVMAASEKDAKELMLAAKDMRDKFADRPFTAIAMGEQGQVSRIEAGRIGSALVFAKGGTEAAPGQLSIETLICKK